MPDRGAGAGASVSGRELPVNDVDAGIPALGPGRDRVSHRRLVRQALPETLPGQHTQLQLRHIQPAAMFGRVVNLQFRGESAGFRGWECRIQGGRGVDVELVHNHRNPRSLGIVDIDELLDAVGELQPGAPRPHRHATPAP